MIEMMDGQKMTIRKNTSPGEVSFSSYHTTAEQIFVHKFAEPQDAIRRLQRNKSQVGDEICVFGAERYFNMKLDDDDYDDAKFSSKQDDFLHQMGPTPRPSASSDASWSSQGVLLRSLMKDRSVNKQKRVDGGRRFCFANLSCSRSCSDTKSVHTKEVTRNNNLIQTRFHVKDHEFDDLILSLGSNKEASFKSQLDDDPRKSLEVFGSTGSTAVKKGDITKNLEKKLSMLTWDAIPNTPIVSSVSRSTRVDEDVESDCSSDLFEIDTIGMSSCMTPYAPSETSIEWSAITAGAADCSFVLDYHDQKKPKTAGRVANVTKEVQRSRSGGILGCKSHKAVMVAETAYIRDAKTKIPSIINL